LHLEAILSILLSIEIGSRRPVVLRKNLVVQT